MEKDTQKSRVERLIGENRILSLFLKIFKIYFRERQRAHEWVRGGGRGREKSKQAPH